MKTVRPYLPLTVLLVTAMALLLASGPPLAAQAPTAPPQVKRQAIKVPIKALNPCPAGWHVAPGSWEGNVFTCVPNKPPAIKCAPKHEYWQSPDGCKFGCRQIIY
jgi:hypothetical protein